MQLDMVTIQGVFLDNVGASGALLQLPEHMMLNPLLCGWVSPHARNQNEETLPHERRRSSIFEGCSIGSLLLLVDGPAGRVLVVMADIQHNVVNTTIQINEKFLYGSTNICNT